MLQDTILDHALPLVPFEGWTQNTLQAAAKSAGLPETEATRAFPEGPAECVEYFARRADARMKEGLATYSLSTMKVRDKVTAAIMLRLEQNLPNREALRRGVALFSMPQHAVRGMRSLYHTVDEIWHTLGDISTDFNFYTKRLMLAGVYATTLRVFLDDDSAGLEHTRSFLARRIENVMQIEKVKSAWRGWKPQFTQAFRSKRKAG